MLVKRLSENEKKYIKENCNKLTNTEIARQLNRTPATIYKFLKKNRIDYYKKGLNPYKLTIREKEVMDLVAIGLNDKEIAKILFLSVSTVKTHIMNIYTKYGVNGSTSRVKAVLKYLKIK